MRTGLDGVLARVDGEAHLRGDDRAAPQPRRAERLEIRDQDGAPRLFALVAWHPRSPHELRGISPPSGERLERRVPVRVQQTQPIMADRARQGRVRRVIVDTVRDRGGGERDARVDKGLPDDVVRGVRAMLGGESRGVDGGEARVRGADDLLFDEAPRSPSVPPVSAPDVCSAAAMRAVVCVARRGP
jgi:hypothetical protein